MAFITLRGKEAPRWQRIFERSHLHRMGTYSLPLGFVLYRRMPTVFRIDGLRVVIWPNDHRPAHVHVIGAEGEAMFLLHCPGGPPELRESFGFRLSDINRIEEALAGMIGALCAEWRKIHGNF